MNPALLKVSVSKKKITKACTDWYISFNWLLFIRDVLNEELRCFTTVWFVVEGIWDWIKIINKQNLRSWYHRASWRSRNASKQEPSCCINNNLCFIYLIYGGLFGEERLRVSITPVCLAFLEGLGWRIMGNAVYTVLFYGVI